MKKIMIILLVALTSLSSCDSYLDVNPTNEIDGENLFEKEIGFQNALNGIYQMCAEPSLYGKNLSWGALSVLAQQYDNETIGYDYTMRYFAEYLYEGSYGETEIESIWKNMFNVIANCNKLIDKVEKASPKLFVLDTLAKNLILGEAYAVRAFCHMDIARIYGSTPSSNDNTIKIPYQDVYPSDYVKSYNTKDIVKKCIEDLLKAKDLVVKNDTLIHKTQLAYGARARFEGSYSSSDGDFYNYRGTRMNYFAVLGLLARAYNYIGDNANALIYADELYSKYYKDKKWLKFNSSYDYTTSLKYKQKKHLEDCLFGFYNQKLIDITETFYQDNKLYVGNVDNMFENDKDDYRLYLIAQEDGNYIHNLKYRSVDYTSRDNYEGRIIPVLRFSEMYYIMAEAYFDRSPAKSLELINEIRQIHGCKRKITSISGRNELINILISDARREFIGEGELFFMYKHFNHAIITKDGEIQPEDKIFRFPIPYSQTIK